MTDVYQEIEEISGVAARKDELLSLHTTFGVGGPCDLMVWVSNLEALKQVIMLVRTHSLPLTILGNFHYRPFLFRIFSREGFTNFIF